MQDSPDGLVPTKDFVHNLLVPDRDFHDGSDVDITPAVNELGENRTAVTIRPPRKSSNTPSYRCSVLEFQELIDSSSMDGTHWNNIVTTLTRNWDMFSAFVILHGTDTLAYTASALSFMLGVPNKTVIVTGSQLSMYYPHNDAHDNLLDSLTLAATYNIPEVSVVFHHHLYRATRVTKVSAFSLAAFTTPNAKPLATIRKGAKKAWTASLHSHTIKLASEAIAIGSDSGTGATSPIRPTSSLDTNRVAVLKVYPGIGSDLISHIAQIPNLGGLVLETFGAGNVPLGSGSKSLLQILSAAVEKVCIFPSKPSLRDYDHYDRILESLYGLCANIRQGIVVVSVTQCKSTVLARNYNL